METHSSTSTQWRAIGICVLVTLCAFQFGYDSSYFSGILNMPAFLKIYGYYDPAADAYIMTPARQSIVTSVINIGEFLGAITSFLIGDAFGRRTGLLISMAGIVVGTIFQMADNLLGLLITGRLVVGYAVGLISCLVPLYVADCAPARYRGALVTMYQFFIAIGLIVGVGVDAGTHTRSDTGSFRIPMAIQLVMPIIIVPCLIFLIPESPRWLAMKGKKEEARRSLTRLHGHQPDLVEHELSLIQTSFEAAQSQKSLWKDVVIWSRDGRKTYLACALQAWSQASGINFIVSYGVVFFADVGIVDPYVINIGLYLITLPGIFLSQIGIEKLGRRAMMLFSGTLIAAVLLVMAGCALDPTKSLPLQRTIVAMVFLFMFVFNCAWGPTTWVITSEISTGPNRGKLMALSTGTNWLCNWLVSFTFPYLYNSSGANLGAKIGFVYGGLMVFGVLWVFLLLPETSGRSLEEIDYLFKNHVSGRKFASYNVPDLDLATAGRKDDDEKILAIEHTHVAVSNV